MIHHWWFVLVIHVVSQLLVGGLFAYPVSLAYWQCRWPAISRDNRCTDVVFNIFWAVVMPWPISVPIMVYYIWEDQGWQGFMWTWTWRPR